jgi:RNA polymerase sigma-70 factor (ECF subfamily)
MECTLTGVSEVSFDRSLREIFDAHAAFVGRSLLCLGVPQADVEDAVQEVFLVVHRRLTEYQERGQLRSWLYGICVRVALRHKRTARRKREVNLPEPPEPQTGAAQQQAVELKQHREFALRALDELPESQRHVFVLFEVERLSMREVADAAGIPLQTAYSRLYAARRTLKASLNRAQLTGSVR